MTDQVEQQPTDVVDQEASLDPRAQTEAATASGEETGSEEDVQALKQRVAVAEEQAADNQEKYLRTRADMENYKKRIERTYADLAKSSKKDLLKRLLSVKDNLDRALHYGEDSGGSGMMEGVRLTHYQLDRLLEHEGVKPIEAVGKPFDPHSEEAVHTVNQTDVPDHTVVEEARKGYTYLDEVLRPAQVVVSVHGQEEES